MNTLKCLIGPIATLATGITAFCQTESHEKEYFVNAITTENVKPAKWAAKKIKSGDIASIRSKLWSKWLEAALSVDEERFPAEAPLSKGRSGHLHIPDSLEPSAIMPFYWGYKGNIATNGHVSLPTYIHIHGSGPKDAEWDASLKWTQVFADAPSRYFIPQIPNEGAYYRWYQCSKQWAWRWLWRQIMLQPGTDPERIYLLGISEGGYGSQRLSAFYADYLAAAGPMAGGEPLVNAPAENLEHIGFSLLTGAEDLGFCRNKYTQITCDALDSLERISPSAYAHRIELIPGQGHHIDYRLTTPWLAQFRRETRPRHFTWEDFEMDGAHRKGFYNLRVDKRPVDTLRTRYDVNIEDNGNIDITVSDVQYIPMDKEEVYGFTLHWAKEYTPSVNGAFTLYLDDELVNLDRKITVTVNGRKVYKGKPALDYRNMVESLATFSDPCRIYPVGISVKY